MITVLSDTPEALLPCGAGPDAVRAALPDWRRRKMDALRFPRDRLLSAAAWFALARLLAGRGLDASRLEVAETPEGKPFFAAPGLPHFNLSHTSGRVLAVVGDRPVGCDAERIGPVDDALATEALAPDERAVFAAADASARARIFCELWTRKESYVKATGAGFCGSPANVRVPEGVRFRPLDLGADCVGCVCGEADDFTSVRVSCYTIES